MLALIAATAVQQRIGSQLGGYFPVIRSTEVDRHVTAEERQHVPHEKRAF